MAGTGFLAIYSIRFELDSCADADDVASLLRRKGIKGFARSTYSCPLAEWICRETGRQAWVVGERCALDHPSSPNALSMPPAAVDFQCRFDMHEYPDLMR